MSIMTSEVVSVKCYEAELAVLDAELEAAQVANDPTRWLAAWNAREDLQITRLLAEHRVCPDDEAAPELPAESEEDGPSELDQVYNTWYALGYDCVEVDPRIAGLDMIRLWVARLAYEKGWARGLADRYTWLDEREWDRIETEEAEVRDVLAGRGYGPDFDEPRWASEDS